MRNVYSFFPTPIYIVDLDRSTIEEDVNYIKENIEHIEYTPTEMNVGESVWTANHNITPNLVPNICSTIKEHVDLFANEIDIKLDNKYSYWFNLWKGANPECTNDRHSHTSSKLVSTLYILNNEPEDATLRVENPAQNMLHFTPYHNSAGKKWWKQIEDISTPAYRLVIWPGFLWHWARYTNSPDAHRISMAIEVS